MTMRNKYPPEITVMYFVGSWCQECGLRFDEIECRTLDEVSEAIEDLQCLLCLDCEMKLYPNRFKG